MTHEQRLINDANKKKAYAHFDVSKGEVLHHKDWRMKHENIERYILWLPEDLVKMTKSEHVKLHWIFDHDERCRKISESNKGKHSKPHKKHKPHNYPKKRKDNIELNGDNKQIINSYLTVAELLDLKD